MIPATLMADDIPCGAILLIDSVASHILEFGTDCCIVRHYLLAGDEAALPPASARTCAKMPWAISSSGPRIADMTSPHLRE